MQALVIWILLAFFSPMAKASDNPTCWVAIDVKSRRQFQSGSACQRSLPPCSTFKVPLAALALEHGKISLQETFRWDEIKREREVLNQDQTVASWLQNSAVWVSAIVAKRFRAETLRGALKRLHYGNAKVDTSEFWLNGVLIITPLQQAKYLVSHIHDPHLREVVNILPADQVAPYTVHGKTGSCSYKNEQVGWYVGRAKSPRREFIFVYAGPEAKTAALDKLKAITN